MSAMSKLSDLERKLVEDSKNDMIEVPNFRKAEPEFASREYTGDINRVILRSIIERILAGAPINDDNVENKIKPTLTIIRNILIVNGKLMEDSPKLCAYVENSIWKYPASYERDIIYKLIRNIKLRKSKANIHFRSIRKIVPSNMPMPVDLRKCLEKKLLNSSFCRQPMDKPSAKFSVGQIVGARDKTFKWWLSRVIYVYNDLNSTHYWYYVHFEGWPKFMREWICSSTYAVRYYNPKKHPLRKT